MPQKSKKHLSYCGFVHLIIRFNFTAAALHTFQQ